jgi:hypothetical protein
MEVRTQYQMPNSFAALKNFDTEDINRALRGLKRTSKSMLKTGYFWFNDECSQFLDHRKRVNIQWLQDPNENNVDNIKNVRCEASRHFRHKEKENQKAQTDEVETNSKTKNIRDLYRVTSLELM